MRQVGRVLVGNGAVVMVRNGGRQEGALLKTPFYVDLHDTKHTNACNTRTQTISHTSIIIKLGISRRGLLIRFLKLSLTPMYPQVYAWQPHFPEINFLTLFPFSIKEESGGKCFANTSTMFAQSIVFLP